MLDSVGLKETIRNTDVRNVLGTLLTHVSMPANKFLSVATNGEPAVLGRNAGLVGLFT
jgi:hypothetical protein